MLKIAAEVDGLEFPTWNCGAPSRYQSFNHVDMSQNWQDAKPVFFHFPSLQRTLLFFVLNKLSCRQELLPLEFCDFSPSPNVLTRNDHRRATSAKNVARAEAAVSDGMLVQSRKIVLFANGLSTVVLLNWYMNIFI